MENQRSSSAILKSTDIVFHIVEKNDPNSFADVDADDTLPAWTRLGAYLIVPNFAIALLTDVQHGSTIIARRGYTKDKTNIRIVDVISVWFHEGFAICRSTPRSSFVVVRQGSDAFSLPPIVVWRQFEPVVEL